MLSEKEIEALTQGSYGVTRSGHKARYLGITKSNYHAWAYYNKDGAVFNICYTYLTFNRAEKDKDSGHDIIGLWEDIPEPFNLERALAGEPIFNNNCQSDKGYLHKSAFNDEEFIVECDDVVCKYDITQLITDFKMWKEPEPVKPSADDLPKPLKEFGDLKEVWTISLYADYDKVAPTLLKAENGVWHKYQYARVKNGIYYATKEDCQAVCDWLMNR